MDVISVFLEPDAGFFAAVGDDRDGFYLEGRLAVFGQLAKKFGVHEGFIACEFFFFHSSGCEEGHSFLCIFEGATYEVVAVWK